MFSNTNGKVESNSMSKKNLGLYIHIPFCRSKCAYCDFYSLPDCREYQRYVDSLLLHMEDYSATVKEYDINTVFIGGGTPSVLPQKCVISLINGIYSNFNVTTDAEFTMEVNPATVSYGNLRAYHDMGVNRLSIGMQSACDNELRALTRIHNFEQFEECYKFARRAKFDNINVDLMYGIPEQTPATLRMSLETLTDLDPEHISLYGLMIEDNTPFAEVRDKLPLPNEDEEYQMYADSIDFLLSQGYCHYEISNFSKPQKQCRHNLKYWFCHEYLGLGPGAHSYFGDHRFSFKRDVQLYMDALESVNGTYELTDEDYLIKPQERVGEYIMLQLRLCRGINIDTFRDLFGLDFEEMYGGFLRSYIDNGYMVKNGSYYAFTIKGMYVSNYILSAMLDFKSNILTNISNGTDR